MSKFIAAVAFAAVGIVSPAFAIYGSYALSAVPAAKLLFGNSAIVRLRLFRTGARVRLGSKRLGRRRLKAGKIHLGPGIDRNHLWSRS